MIGNDLKTGETSAPGAFVSPLIVILELYAFGFALRILQQSDLNAQTIVAMLLFCVFAFTLITGKGFPHFRQRGKAMLFLFVAGYFSLQGANLSGEQREARLAELRKSDPAAYLVELRNVDEDRWFVELRQLDPEAHAKEAASRATQSHADRLAACTDEKIGLAYVMIQEDVRRSLRAPSTAEFPGRFDAGTRNMGNCVYKVIGQYDAQNGFGAMIRGTFTGTTEYSPERGSWRTLMLDVQG
ncbi:hypothetical protein [Roseovarius sp. EL26]|uniref:hypothetical protein n=1 Tax=Roseovarius sp. EL26 TaxID=2126672 RepID=UPI000EA0A9E1|nr:hypothetical protein [Roseovarius sp. EL26]